MRLGGRAKATLWAAIGAVCAGLGLAHPMVAHANNAFTCQPGFYQVISGHLKILNPLTGVYSDIGTAGDTYNAIGFNPVDNFIYGWGSGGSRNDLVVKVDSAGNVTTLGNAGLGPKNYVSGDFDDQGFLWMRDDNLKLAKFDVSVNPATATIVTLTSDTGSVLSGADMGWINNVMYSVNGSTLQKADLTTLKVTAATIVDQGSPAGKAFNGTNGAFGAVFSNRDDELYVSQNATGFIYRITDYTTSSPKATFVVQATVTSNNDGAACKRAVSPFDLPTVVDDTYSTTNTETLTIPSLTGIFSNDNASGASLVSNSNPSSGTLTLNQDGSFTYVPEPGFIGTTTFTYTAQDQWGRTTSSATVTITVSAPTTTTSVAPATSTTTLAVAPTSTSVATPLSETSDDENADESGALPTTGGSGEWFPWVAGVLWLTGLTLRRRVSKA